MKKILAAVSVSCLALLSTRTFAGQEGNAGDTLAIEFVQLGKEAILEVEGDPILFSEAQTLDLNAVLDGARVLVTDRPLFVEQNGVRQSSIAINHRNPDTIVVNRERWNAIAKTEFKTMLALHEVLGLAGLEGTGNYRYSSVLLEKRRLQCPDDICQKSALAANFDVATARDLFMNSREAAPAHFQGNWLRVASADTWSSSPAPLAGGAVGGGVAQYLTFHSAEAGGVDVSSVNVLIVTPVDANFQSNRGQFEVSWDNLGASFNDVAVVGPHPCPMDYRCRLAREDYMVCALRVGFGSNQVVKDALVGDEIGFELFKQAP